MVGASELHELLFEPSGNIKKENMPSEVFYKAVNLKVGRPIARKRRVDLNQGFIDEVAELEETNVEPEPEVRERRQGLRTRNRRAIVDDILADIEDDSENDSEDSF